MNMVALTRIYLKIIFPFKEILWEFNAGWFLIKKWLRTQILESALGLLLLVLILKLYYSLLNVFKPIIERLAPKYTGSVSYRMGSWIYCRVVPRPKTLLRYSWRIFRCLEV